MRPPKPLRVGARTGGPPLSVQRKLSRPSSWCDQFNSICPLDTDKDPYLAALVASSCNVTAMACAALGSNKTSGPTVCTRLYPVLEKGASSCLAIVDTSAPIQRVATNSE